MTKPFPAPLAEGMDDPCRFDIEVYDLEIVEGAVPSGIDGLLVQAVPDQFYPPEVKVLYPMTIAAGGDGAVRAFRIKNGYIDFKSRYVRTERYLLERKARRSLYGNYRDPFTDDPSVKGKSRTTANTAVYFHAGRMLASKEDGLPYEVDPHSLETKGVWRADGRITSLTFTAHPKFDAETGQMFGFGYAAKGEATRDVAYYVVDKQGRIEHEVWFEAPYSAMIHDCALTKNYMVFPIMPYTSDLARLKAGGPHFVYDGSMPLVFGVLPRFGKAQDVRWFKAPPAFAGHTVNAYEEGGKIVLDFTEAEAIAIGLGEIQNDLAYEEGGKIVLDFTEADGNGFGPVVPDRDGNVPAPGSVTTRLVRRYIDYHAKSDQLTEREVLAVVNGEGCHIDARRELKPYRHVFVPTLDPSKLITDKNGRVFPVMFNQLTHFDLKAGQREDWFPGPAGTFQDPVYLPKSVTAEEGDGYLIAILNWPLEVRSELVILDTRKLTAGPIARAKIPVRMRLGIHSTWIDGAQLPPDPSDT